MSTYTGLDIAPSALRWIVRDGTDASEKSGGPIYGVRGCPRHSDRGYDSADSWSDMMAFRESEFSKKYEFGVEKTVCYKLPEGNASEWLRSFFHSTEGHPSVDVNGTISVAIPNHASPEERDDVLAGLSTTKYANASLIWRPVAALLGWMEQLKTERGGDLSTLIGRRIFILDLDAGCPELTELECVRHKKQSEWIIPSRKQPTPDTLLTKGTFARDCYRATLDGVPEWEQIVGGQFYANLQRAIELGDKGFEAWIRHRGAWQPRKIEFAHSLPRDILKSINPILSKMWKTINDADILLVNGWVARKYEEQILTPLRGKCGHVMATSADSIARGAALFAERLAKGLPTFYDRIAKYQYWDGFKSDWIQMFDENQEVEPGHEYRYPEAGAASLKLRVEKFADNVSFYVRVPNTKDFARRIKTVFSEFLCSELELSLSAVVRPEKASASFILAMCDAKIPAIFVSGKTKAREIVLRWREDDNAANKEVSVQEISEHQGYVEAQPVLGRIYDSEDNLRMVEEYIKIPRGAAFAGLWAAYCARFHPNKKNGIADRVGYPKEPTRGLFGTRYAFNTRVDKATRAFAEKCAQEIPYVTTALLAGSESLLKDGMLRQNYCHSSALDDYKNLIRSRLISGDEPQRNFNFYYAAGYVLGEDSRDIEILLNYICLKTNLTVERSKLWWSFFRMLCWHPECRLTADIKPLLEKALNILCDEDVAKVEHEGMGSSNDIKYLPLAILYALRIRESGEDLSEALKDKLIGLLSVGLLINIEFPKTMIPKIDPASHPTDDTLSEYVLRFLKKEDTLVDRELGAALGGV